jgi:hypothetical protein
LLPVLNRAHMKTHTNTDRHALYNITVFQTHPSTSPTGTTPAVTLTVMYTDPSPRCSIRTCRALILMLSVVLKTVPPSPSCCVLCWKLSHSDPHVIDFGEALGEPNLILYVVVTLMSPWTSRSVYVYLDTIINDKWHKLSFHFK